MQELLRVEALSTSIASRGKEFRLVSDVSFSLREGETLVIVGESGSGKTTCAHSIIGLLASKKKYHLTGKVLFEGKNLLELSERQKRSIRGAKISMIFQDPSAALHPLFSIGQQIAEMFEIHLDLSEEEAEEKAIEILNQVGLSKVGNFFEVYPHQFSGGMKQRAMIAMAVSLGPKVLIADEPTSALDLTVQKEILALLKEWKRRHAMACLLITHDFGVVAEMAEMVAVMYAAEFVEYGTASDIFFAPAHPYTQVLESRPTKENRKKLLPAPCGTSVQSESRPEGCQFHPRCPFAMEKCRTGKVPTFTKSTTHWVRCWLHEK